MNENINDLLERIKRGAAIAGETVERTVKAAGEKTGEFVEGAKINLHIVDLQMREKDIQRDIGALVYEAHKDANTNTERVDGMLEELDALHEEIRECKERYAEVRQHRVCPACKADIGRKDDFCRKCGEKVQ